MEASRFGFGPALPPAFKFDPTDADIVAHYLLPRALGVPDPPFAHAVIEDDPASLPPRDLLARHGHGTSHHAFFLDTTDATSNAGRREREIKGDAAGVWRGQQGHHETLTLLSPAGEVDITYKRYDLTYKEYGDLEQQEEEEEARAGRKRKRGDGGAPSGWVMHEYRIVSPPLHNIVLSHIKLTKAKIKQDQQQAGVEAEQLDHPAAAVHQQQHFLPPPGQPAPSHNQLLEDQPGPSSLYYQGDFLYQEQQAGPSGQDLIPYQEQQAGPSHYHHPLAMVCGGGGEGFSDGSQADDSPCYGSHNGGAVTGDSYLNLLLAGEGLYYNGFNFTGGGDIELTHHATDPADDQANL